MTDLLTTRDEQPARSSGGLLERRDIDPHAELEDEAETPIVWRGVMRPVRIGAIPPIDSNRPTIVEHPTLWQTRLPRPKARTDLVVVTRHGKPQLLGAPGAPSWWKLLWSRGTLYEVDLGLHHTNFEIELPSSGDTFAFRAHVSVEWRVNRAVTVVADNLADVREALAPVARQHLSAITRTFDVGDVIAAERAVGDAVRGRDLGRDYGLGVTLSLRLSADTGAAEYAMSRRELQQKIEIEKLKQEHHRLEVSHEQEVIRTRMDLYRRIIDSGNVDQLALQLAQNPSGAESIAALVREERQHERRQVTDFISHLLESGVLDRWDVEEQVQTALAWLKDSTERTVQTGEAHIPREHRAPSGHQNGSVMTEDNEPTVFLDVMDGK